MPTEQTQATENPSQIGIVVKGSEIDKIVDSFPSLNWNEHLLQSDPPIYKLSIDFVKRLIEVNEVIEELLKALLAEINNNSSGLNSRNYVINKKVIKGEFDSQELPRFTELISKCNENLKVMQKIMDYIDKRNKQISDDLSTKITQALSTLSDLIIESTNLISKINEIS